MKNIIFALIITVAIMGAFSVGVLHTDDFHPVIAVEE